ncbi:hypothetical protein K439DRAFT_1619724 [Ramaria rubella]|nr:hypothetical protein K439DRAFT_1619724 [Ramaria rubella]
MAAFIDDEADEGENGSSDEVDHEEYEEQEAEQEEDEELKVEDNDLGPDEDFIDVEEDDRGIADILVIPTSIESDVVSLKGPVVVVCTVFLFLFIDDPENMSSVYEHVLSCLCFTEIEQDFVPWRGKSFQKEDIYFPREGISASGVCDEVIVYHEDLIPSKTDYTNVDVILSAVESALVLWSQKSLQLCGVCENVDHPGIDHELKKHARKCYKLTIHMEQDHKVQCHWKQHSQGTDALVGGFMFGQVVSCTLKSKVVDSSNFIKPKTRSSISIVVIEMEWEHVTSMLSMVAGNIKLAFPTFSQGVVFGTIVLESGRTGGAQLSKIEGLSSPKKGVTLNRHVVQLGKTSGWKESYFANEHIPIYSAPHGGKVTDDPVLATPVCVVSLTSLYDSLGSSAADTVAFNVQCVVVLE